MFYVRTYSCDFGDVILVSEIMVGLQKRSMVLKNKLVAAMPDIRIKIDER
jgi:hypothetical protein